MKSSTTEVISLWQLFVLMMAFLVDMTIIIQIGEGGEQHAWIAPLISGAIGMLLALFYHRLLEQSGKHDLYDILRYLTGKLVGNVLSFFYVAYFLLSAATSLRHFEEILTTALLTKSPNVVLGFIIMVLVIKMVNGGIEIITRTIEILFPYKVAFIVLLLVLLILTGNLEVRNLGPLVERNTFEHITTATFPGLITNPFGQLIVLTVLYRNVTKFNMAKKVMIWCISISSVLIAISIFLQILTLSPTVRERAVFPALTMIRRISVGEFIERMDAFVAFIMMIGVIIEVSVFFYVAIIGLEKITCKSRKAFTFPIAMLIVIFSTHFTDNYIDYVRAVNDTLSYLIHLPFQYVFPVIMFVGVLLKNKSKKDEQHGISS